MVEVKWDSSSRPYRTRVRRVSAWFSRFRRWARDEDLRYTALGDGRAVFIENLGSGGATAKRRRLRKLRK